MSEFQSGIRDNRQRGSVGDFLRQHIQPNAQLAVVSAYFTIYAFNELRQQLSSIEQMRFLFGEPRFIRSLDPDKTDQKAFNIEDAGLTIHNRLQQKRIARECAEWISQKVEIRSVKRANFLHGKMYHLQHGNLAQAILGSSNFTVRGLGLGTQNNIELNLEVDSKRDLADLKRWFDELWDDQSLVYDVKAAVLEYLKQLYQYPSPQFIYYKTLYHLFEQFLNDYQDRQLFAEQSQFTDSAIWQTLFTFQKDGVRGAINKIMRHQGCIIADSVGLGKTFEALAIIRYFELLNYRVLVLCPKKLRDNWTVYQAHNNSPLNPFLRDRLSYTVLSHTDLSRDHGRSGDIDLSTLNWGNYDLVVIDESHNFRNNVRGKRADDGSIIRKTRYERLMDEVIRSGVKTKVLLLSATPVNNDLKDLRNQLYFLTENDDAAFRESLGIASLSQTLTTAQRTFNDWAKQAGERSTRGLLDQLGSEFFVLLDELTIARSRKHIQRYYADTMAELGGFPERAKPQALYPEIDLRGRFLSYDRLNDEISHYQLALFSPSAYVLPEFAAEYEQTKVRNFKQGVRERFLIGMMKVNFLKRLESSVHSFALTMERTINKIELLEQRIERFKQLRSTSSEFEVRELSASDFAGEGFDEELREALEVGQKFIYRMAHLDVDRWLHDLRRDKQQLDLLLSSASMVTPEHDAKLSVLKQLIAQKISQPTITNLGTANRKLLIFTAFADTARYLYECLADWASQLGVHSALVTGDGANRTTFGQAEFNHILTNFSPIAKKRAQIASMPQDQQIDLLIATDCISEGQNLQDCDLLINYDIHWNPVRIIQRFGRIDRIGSINPVVQLVNFWPTHDLNKYINLKNRVEARMALVDISATFEDNLLAPDALEDLVSNDLKYRDKQLLRLQTEVLDLEDLSDSVAITDFSLDDFRMDLLRFLEQNRTLLRDAPLGLYTVVPVDPRYEIIQPGVIFCLRQRDGLAPEARGSQINPTQPYYLVYLRNDGEVRLRFTQPKHILELMQILCADASQPHELLCRLFDRETNDGDDMQLYNRLLDAAINATIDATKQRSAQQLTRNRGGLLPTSNQQVHSASDFELITWLVIK
ncbi:helicase-related protein [Herpetosiphon geysericola]|uniref:ATP-dependent helicase n=1 Tax=Herpetosiphon geysericola TaxID=70996 RepID=A0A0P6YKM1_9CHLR|nr:helicase-related protein [Herpetosiphon geysericola]KPL91182.1 ATP-dependent helicase [Herpetosiphon geysericola]